MYELRLHADWTGRTNVRLATLAVESGIKPNQIGKKSLLKAVFRRLLIAFLGLVQECAADDDQQNEEN